MKDLIPRLNKAFESRIRLAVMSLLMVEEEMEFNQLKEMLELTDGNLSSHVSKLEEAGYLLVEKRFQGKKPLTSYKATEAGRKAFKDHLDALEELIKKSE